MIPIFWINLDSRTDRRAFMERQFAELSLSAVRVRAVEPGGLAAAARRTALSVGESCVTASHLAAWRRVIDSGASHALVLEDDARLSVRMPLLLSSAMDACSGLDLVRIETGRRLVRVGPATRLLSFGVKLRPAFSAQWGTAGYLIAAQCAARLLDHPGVFEMPLDHFLFDPTRPGFAARNWRQCDPGLCIQLDQLEVAHALGGSDVTNERRRVEGKPGRAPKSAGEKIIRETSRLSRQTLSLLRDAKDLVTRGIWWRRIRFQP